MMLIFGMVLLVSLYGAFFLGLSMGRQEAEEILEEQLKQAPHPAGEDYVRYSDVD